MTVLEYDGSEFHGWQIQPNKRTVQEEIEKAVLTITGEKVRVTGAGRTDAGVHALGQAASFPLQNDIEENSLKRAMNAVLPEDVRIYKLEEKEITFNARRDALSRTYRYIISKKNRAIGRQYAWYPKLRYNLESMMGLSKVLKGQHCWKAFCKNDGSKENFISNVFDVNWNLDEREIQFEITAERFFHNMVRIVLGTLFDVGRGKMSALEFQDLFNTQDRKMAGITVPPYGLFLVRVDYQGITTKP